MSVNTRMCESTWNLQIPYTNPPTKKKKKNPFAKIPGVVIVAWDKLRLELTGLARFDKICTGRKIQKCTHHPFGVKNIKPWLLNWKRKGHTIRQIRLSKEGTGTAVALSLCHYSFDLLLTLFWKDVNGETWLWKEQFYLPLQNKSYFAKVKREYFPKSQWIAQ